MELFIGTLLVSSALLIAWKLYLRRDLISLYLAGITLFLYFIIPAILALSEEQTAASYAVDGGFIFALVTAFGVLLFGLSWQAHRGRSRLRREDIDQAHLVRLSTNTNVWIVLVYTLYLALTLFASFNLVPEGLSRSEFLLAGKQDSIAEGSWFFLGWIGRVVAYFALLGLILSEGTARRFGILALLFWFVLQAGSMVVAGLHRSPIIFLVVTHIIVVHTLIRRIPASLYRGALISILIAAPFLMSDLQYFREDVPVEARAVGVENRFIHGLRGVSTALEFYRLVEGTRDGRYEYEYGRQLINTGLVWVPRVLWKEKPVVSFSFRKTEELYGTVRPGNGIRTFTFWGEGFVQFGYAGMVAYSVLLTLLVRIVKALWLRIPGLTYPILSYVVSFPLLARADLFAFVSRIIPIGIVGLAVIFLSQEKGRKLDAPPRQVGQRTA